MTGGRAWLGRGLALAVMMVAPGTAFAQTPAPVPRPAASADEPSETTATFGTWVLHCVELRAAPASQNAVSTKPPVRSCEIVQTITVGAQNTPFARLAFGYPPGKDANLLVTAALPVDIALPGFAHVSGNAKQGKAEKGGIDLAWSRCAAGACFANAVVNPSLLKTIQQEKSGQLRFQNARGQTVAIPLSWNGFGKALAALVVNGRLH